MLVSKEHGNPEHVAISESSGRKYGGIASQERQRQRRTKLIEAGLEVFGEKGFHSSTVRDVCKKAQLTSRYFYESFDGMQALFLAVYAEVARELMRSTVVALERSPPGPEQITEAALRAFLEFIRDDPHRARVTLIDALNVSSNVNHVSDQLAQDFAALIQRFSEQLFPKFNQSGLSHAIVADGLVGAVSRIVTQWVADRCQTPLEEVLRNVYSIFHACILYARTSDAPRVVAEKPLVRQAAYEPRM